MAGGGRAALLLLVVVVLLLLLPSPSHASTTAVPSAAVPSSSSCGSGEGNTNILISGTSTTVVVLTIVMMLFIALLVGILFLLLRHAKKDANNVSIMTLFLCIIDFGTDIAFVYNNYALAVRNDSDGCANLYPIYYTSLVFLIVPSVVNLTFGMGTLWYQRQANDASKKWFDKHWIMATFIVLCSVGNYEVLLVLSSRILDMPAFSLEFMPKCLTYIKFGGLISNILDDLPQLILTAYLVQKVNGSWSIILILTFCLSCLSLLFGMLKKLFLLFIQMAQRRFDSADFTRYEPPEKTPVIIISMGNKESTLYADLAKGPLRLGRAQPNSVPGVNMLLFQNKVVSKKHLEIKRVKQESTFEFVICDVGSSTHTYLNNQKLQIGTLYSLKVGDQVQLGRGEDQNQGQSMFRSVPFNVTAIKTTNNKLPNGCLCIEFTDSAVVSVHSLTGHGPAMMERYLTERQRRSKLEREAAATTSRPNGNNNNTAGNVLFAADNATGVAAQGSRDVSMTSLAPSPSISRQPALPPTLPPALPSTLPPGMQMGGMQMGGMQMGMAPGMNTGKPATPAMMASARVSLLDPGAMRPMGGAAASARVSMIDPRVSMVDPRVSMISPVALGPSAPVAGRVSIIDPAALGPSSAIAAGRLSLIDPAALGPPASEVQRRMSLVEPVVPTIPPVVVLDTVADSSWGLHVSIYQCPLYFGRVDLAQGTPNMIDLRNEAISPKHLSIQYQMDGRCFCIQDEGSTYGTHVNGMELPKRRPVRLEPRSTVVLGQSVMFEIHEVVHSGDPNFPNGVIHILLPIVPYMSDMILFQSMQSVSGYGGF